MKNNRDFSLTFEEVLSALSGLVGLPPQEKSQAQSSKYECEYLYPQPNNLEQQQQQKVTDQLNKVHDSLSPYDCGEPDMTQNIPCVLSCTYDAFGNIFYKNEQGQLHNPNDWAVFSKESQRCSYYLNDVEYEFLDWEKETEKQVRRSLLEQEIQKQNQKLRSLLTQMESLKS